MLQTRPFEENNSLMQLYNTMKEELRNLDLPLRMKIKQ